MKINSPNNARPEAPPWAVILIALAFVLASAWLVFMDEWVPWKAFLVVCFTVLLIDFALLAELMILEGQEESAEIWQQFMQMLIEYFDLLLKYFRLKK